VVGGIMPVINYVHTGKMEISEGTSDLVFVVKTPNNNQIAVFRLHWNNLDDPFDIVIDVSTQFDAVGLEISSNDLTVPDSACYAEFATPYVQIVPLIALEENTND
jgi:hypothetical protein